MSESIRTTNWPRSRHGPRASGASRAGVVLAFVLVGGLPASVAAAGEPPKESDTIPVVGRDDLIGKLIPITGDPLETRSVDLRVGFRKNSAELTERAVAQLRELGAALLADALAEVPIGIYGHTDSRGPADYNRELSERRAEAVAAWLAEHVAIAEERFREVRGFGEERPREDLPHDDPAQRRVEIVTFHPHRAPDDESASPQPGGTGGDGVVVTIQGGDESPERAPEDEGKRGVGGVIVIE